MKAIRFRRLDKYNFVTERLCAGTSGRWKIENYFRTPDRMLMAVLRDGITGCGADELLASLRESEARVLEAFQAALESRALLGGSRRGTARCTSNQHAANARDEGRGIDLDSA